MYICLRFNKKLIEDLIYNSIINSLCILFLKMTFCAVNSESQLKNSCLIWSRMFLTHFLKNVQGKNSTLIYRSKNCFPVRDLSLLTRPINLMEVWFPLRKISYEPNKRISSRVLFVNYTLAFFISVEYEFLQNMKFLLKILYWLL